MKEAAKGIAPNWCEPSRAGRAMVARHYCRQESRAKRGSQPASRCRKISGVRLGEGNGPVSAQNEPDPIRGAQFLADAMQMSFHRAFCDPKLSRDDFNLRAPAIPARLLPLPVS